MNNGRLEKELLELICKNMFIQDIKEYDKSKLQLILKFLEQNNIDSLENIAFVGAGTYSSVFKVNDFVIKIGLAKIREKSIESPNIAKSLVRLNIKFITSKMTIVVGIEIQPFTPLTLQLKKKEKSYKTYTKKIAKQSTTQTIYLKIKMCKKLKKMSMKMQLKKAILCCRKKNGIKSY